MNLDSVLVGCQLGLQKHLIPCHVAPLASKPAREKIPCVESLPSFESPWPGSTQSVLRAALYRSGQTY